MPTSKYMEWQAFYLIDGSDQDPEVTEWDDDASAAEKLGRIAASKEEAR